MSRNAAEPRSIGQIHLIASKLMSLPPLSFWFCRKFSEINSEKNGTGFNLEFSKFIFFLVFSVHISGKRNTVSRGFAQIGDRRFRQGGFIISARMPSSNINATFG